MSKEYIEKERALHLLEENASDDEVFFAARAIEAEPPADVKPVVRSEWFEGDYIDQWYCPECKFTVIAEDYPSWNFCPNCGADMRGESPR